MPINKLYYLRITEKAFYIEVKAKHKKLHYYLVDI